MSWQGPFDLVLDASEGVLSLVLLAHGQILVSQEWKLEQRATEVLAPALQMMLSLTQLSLKDLRRIACVHGPGSFTAIRLLLTTAMGLRRLRPLELGALNALQLTAFELVRRKALAAKQKIVVVTKARRKLLHVQSFLSNEQALPEPLGPVVLQSPSALLESLTEGDYLCGSILKNCPDLSSSASNLGLQVLADLERADPQTLALAAGLISYEPADLEPLYVRPCDALDNLERLAERQGLNGARARQSLDSLLKAPPCSEL
ncbi:MAG: tRNA (adenosine(37)-N6)-threonylcarbamoyltransferase complex dimerization subunit type 1 TsaB [Desulfovibrio sp.]|nr:tRNA (adenosine(37)-N6)-threonylcarbamoyltransferase complex dimerization subunit type 1 TsaB [Desulfovibrio sp.]